MPIQLTTPFNPGDLDPGKTYPIVKILDHTVDSRGGLITIHTAYGYLVDGVWQQGIMSRVETTQISGQDYLDMGAEVPDGIKSRHDDTADALYQYLLDKGVYTGTVV